MTKRGGKKSYVPWLVTIGLIVIAVIAVTAITFIMQGTNVAVLNPKGTVAAAEFDLFVFTFWLSVAVVVPVFFMIGFFAWRYREGNTRAKYTPDVDGNRAIEAVWWGIPIIVIGILSVVTWVSTHQLDPYKPLVSDKEPIHVQVVSMQWKWLFLYPDYEVASLNVLKMPVGVPVNFEITGDAPMSAFWIPNLGTQTYAMNGMSAKLSLIANESGTYRGSNSNISGEGYADMYFNVETVPDMGAFEQWAEMIRGDGTHDHMDAGHYEDLRIPSRKEVPRYYHLHDIGLYDKVLSKYMHHGASLSEGGHNDGH